MALHEIWEVSNLLIGLLPYEEYFPCDEKQKQLEKEEPVLYETTRSSCATFSFVSTLIPVEETPTI